MSLCPEERKGIRALKDIAVAEFNQANWRELGIITGTYDFISNHPRLLCSLSSGDYDYEGLNRP